MTDAVVLAHRLNEGERATEIIQGVGEALRLDALDASQGMVAFPGNDYEQMYAYVIETFEAQGSDWAEHWSVPHRDSA